MHIFLYPKSNNRHGKKSPLLQRKNNHVFAWVFYRCDGKDNYIDTAIGYMPKEGAINTDGLNISAEAMKEITSVDKEGWKKEIADIRANHYLKFKDHLHKELSKQLDILEANLQKI